MSLATFSDAYVWTILCKYVKKNIPKVSPPNCKISVCEFTTPRTYESITPEVNFGRKSDSPFAIMARTASPIITFRYGPKTLNTLGVFGAEVAFFELFDDFW